MLDDFRSAYRNYNAVCVALTHKATQSFAAGGSRLWTAAFPRRDWAPLSRALSVALSRALSFALSFALSLALSLLRALARSRWAIGTGVVVLAILPAMYEMQSSHLQARYFSDLAHKMTVPLKPGASTSILFPDGGPYDQRMGYAALPRLISRLAANGYVIRDQAHWSPDLTQFVKKGAFPVYREKDQGGLDILDRNGSRIYGARFPQTVYRRFAAVPPLLVNSLLFTEDRYLLDRTQPHARDPDRKISPFAARDHR
jgi:hypothetical protein